MLNEENKLDGGHVSAQETDRVNFHNFTEFGEQAHNSFRGHVLSSERGGPEKDAHVGPGWGAAGQFLTLESDADVLMHDEGDREGHLPSSMRAKAHVHSPNPRGDKLKLQVREGVEERRRNGTWWVVEAVWRLEPDNGKATRGLQISGRHKNLRVVWALGGVRHR
jgi:hypothetical protein